jgi:hypothetical protein
MNGCLDLFNPYNHSFFIFSLNKNSEEGKIRFKKEAAFNARYDHREHAHATFLH